MYVYIHNIYIIYIKIVLNGILKVLFSFVLLNPIHSYTYINLLLMSVTECTFLFK